MKVFTIEGISTSYIYGYTFDYHPINVVITDLKLADGNNCN